MVVDDDQLVRDFAVHTLEYGLNQRVVTFESGFDAWQFIRQHPHKVDVIIADANIPDMDGFELLRFVKQSTPDKFFVITAGDPDMEDIAGQYLADAFISKPYDARDLFAVIRNYASTGAAAGANDIAVFKDYRPPSE